ncbi:MAG: DUF4389 domain-containing protein [Actinomycetota bacterium]
MSEMSGGPGYWQASDGLWYPPADHPDEAYRAQWAAVQQQPAAAIPGAGAAQAGAYPARLSVSDDNRIARWRIFVHIFMAIPHMIILYLLGIASQVVGLISWFVILFTGKMPAGLHNFQSMYLRYSNRTFGFIILLTEVYPPFDFETTSLDGSGHPIRSDYDHQAEGRNRLTAFFRILMVIPHYIVLAFVFVAAYVVYIIAWFAVLFTGKMPTGLRDFLIGTGRWVNRVQAYFWLLTDRYPPFSMD